MEHDQYQNFRMCICMALLVLNLVLLLQIMFVLCCFNFFVATLALGSQPRQGVARLRPKRETWESLHMLPGVQRM
jgi:hypothetical protein